MKISFFKKAVVGVIISGALLFSACSKKADNPDEVVIPDSPDAAVQTILSEFAEGNGEIIWSALPASYQSDINELMHLAGSKTDKDIYDKSFSLFARLSGIIEQQKAFMANSALNQNNSAEDSSQLEAILPSVSGIIETIATSELSTVEGLYNFDGKEFFGTTVSKCIEYLDKIGQVNVDGIKLADYKNAVVSVVESDGQKATLSIAVPGQEKREVLFTKVENRWVPAEIESEWTANFAKMTAKLEATSAEQTEAQKTQIIGALTMLDGILTKIESAKTQEQFDESLRSAVLPVMGIFMMLGQAASDANQP